jgi:hypothetical protein
MAKMAFQFSGESRVYLIYDASIIGWKEGKLNFACKLYAKINSRWINNSSMNDFFKKLKSRMPFVQGLSR